MPNLRIIGMGNILYRDEGVGVFAVNCLRSCFSFSPAVDFEDGGLAGFGLIDLIFEPASVLVLDAIATDAAPGTIFRLGPEALADLGPNMKPTAHEVDPLHVFKLAAGLGAPIDMVLLGIVPADALDFRLGLTPELTEVFETYLAAALAEIRSHGITVTQKMPISLPVILDSLAKAPR